MEFDIVEISDEELKNFTPVQMQILRTAQKNKNELVHKMEKELALFKKLVYTRRYEGKFAFRAEEGRASSRV